MKEKWIDLMQKTLVVKHRIAQFINGKILTDLMLNQQFSLSISLSSIANIHCLDAIRQYFPPSINCAIQHDQGANLIDYILNALGLLF